jgi:hypothetical protein
MSDMGIDLLRQVEEAAVSLAADAYFRHTPHRSRELLPPHLWEALRIEMQQRWREATGEQHAILRIEDPTP